MRGEILEISGEGAGLVSGDDGQRYKFAARDVSGFIPHRGDRIDFVPAGDVAASIVLLSAGPAPLPPSFSYHGRRDDGPTSPWGYFVRCMKKYVDGSGRAGRSEYWWFILFRTLIVFPVIMIGGALSSADEPTSGLALTGSLLAALGGLLFIATILPQFVATIRRLHDVGQSGWLMLLNLIPYVGGLVILVFTLLPGQRHPNEHGPPPGSTGRAQADVFS